MMQLPDSIYNRVQDFFTNRYHCTRYAGHLSTVAGIKASVIQGSKKKLLTYLLYFSGASMIHWQPSRNPPPPFPSSTFCPLPFLTRHRGITPPRCTILELEILVGEFYSILDINVDWPPPNFLILPSLGGFPWRILPSDVSINTWYGSAI